MYADIDDMTTRFGEQELLELTDANLTGTVNAAVVQTAICDATELINGYVAGRYRVPLAPVPDMVRRWCCDIARFYLHNVAVPDAVKAGHDAALQGLREVARGVVQLQAAGAETSSASGEAVLAVGSRIFTDGNMRGF
jgi:phage gp36-like protein